MPKNIIFPSLAEVKSKFSYDPQTGAITYINAWGKRAAGAVSDFMRPDGYRQVFVNTSSGRRAAKSHRLAWYIFYGEDPGPVEIDHINRDKADNSIANLRKVLRGQNLVNSVRSKPSGLPIGVSYKPNGSQKPYTARIKRRNVEMWLGRFATVNEAAAAYRKAAEGDVWSEYNPMSRSLKSEQGT